ncbi:MAG: hypothetical protein RLZZ30_77 [Bacteroidota bacterium]|jgi:hypothetical protein
MRLSWILRTFINSICLFLTLHLQAQTSPTILDFSDAKIISAETGYTSAPFSLQYPYSNEIDKITFKNNLAPFLRLGFNYKWFVLRFSIPNIANIRDASNYGRTKQYNLGMDFSFNKVYYDFEFKYIHGFAIKDANRWDPNLDDVHRNSIQPKIQSLNISANAWYFHNKDFKMGALLGKRSYYTKLVHTWYVKGTMNFFGVDTKNGGLIPSVLQDEQNAKTMSSTFSAFDIGFVPGYAYVNRFKNWQIAGWAGLGPVIQAKYDQVNGDFHGFLGLAPRYDIRLMAGYTTPKRFLFLVTDFDNKSIRFNQLIYRQYFYTVKLVGGYRFPKKDKKQHKMLERIKL